jgi:hypothetical protein
VWILSELVEYRPDPGKDVEAHLQQLLLIDIRKVESLVNFDSFHDNPVEQGEAQLQSEAIMARIVN